MSFDKDFDMKEYKTIDEVPILRSQINTLQMRLQMLERDNERLQKQLESYRNVPAIVGVVQEIIRDKAIVRNYNGIVFAVRIPDKWKDVLEIGSRVALAQHNLSIVDVFSKDIDYRVNSFDLIERPDVSFKDIGGLEDVIQELEETVSLPLSKPKLFEKYGIDSPKGILLYGPPGTGKTLLAKAVANKSKAKFIALSGSDLVHKYIGEGARLVKDLFDFARKNQPAVIFIDEIDAVAAYRTDSTSGGDREVHRTMMQLLVELDGFRKNDLVKIIAATNRIDIIDQALLRPGRLDRIIYVPLPDLEARKKILKIHSSKMPLAKDVKINDIAKICEKASGAELASICREAAIFAIREKKSKVDLDCFKKAITKVLKNNDEEELSFNKVYR